jgi:hypothetical protein
MNAMTWWDHETGSIWSQPWGRAIDGDFRGVELFLLPSEVTSWANWKADHPQSLAMTNDLRLQTFPDQEFSPNFVLGLLLAGDAKAYYYEDVIASGLVNDTFANLPIVVWADEAGLNAYFREVEGQSLTFEFSGEDVIDIETGSRWDLGRGLALDGPHQGQALQQVPSTTSYDWAWIDFYPDSAFYAP